MRTLEQIGWGYEWPEGSPIRFSFMVNEPQQDEDQWFPLHRWVETEEANDENF